MDSYAENTDLRIMIFIFSSMCFILQIKCVEIIHESITVIKRKGKRNRDLSNLKSYFVKTGSWASITLIRRNMSAAVVPNRNRIRSNAVRSREGKYGLPRINDRKISTTSATRSWSKIKYMNFIMTSILQSILAFFPSIISKEYTKWKLGLLNWTILTLWAIRTSYTAQIPTTVIPCSLHNVAITT